MKNQIQKELICLWASPQHVWVSLAFCGGIFILFPFVMNLSDSSLSNLFPALLWVSVFFTLFLTVDSFYVTDFTCQLLHHHWVEHHSFFTPVTVKMFCHFLVVTCQHLVLLPLLALLYHVDMLAALRFVPFIALGTATLTLLTHFAQILIVSLNRKGILALLILIPLVVPVLIFASACCNAVMTDADITVPLSFLGAIFLLSAGILPYTSSLILGEAIRQ